ncbi:MAG: hypothetical protein FWE09_04435 [Treponema sp.]|nr:hypothetical protein [Treponema sp.]
MSVLPDEDHYTRFCKRIQVQGGKVLSSAFMLRSIDTDGLSGDHFEHFASNNYEQILEALKARGFKGINDEAYFATLNCRDIIDSSKQMLYCIKQDKRNSHALLIGLEQGDASMSERLVTLVKEKKRIGDIRSPAPSAS